MRVPRMTSRLCGRAHCSEKIVKHVKGLPSSPYDDRDR